MNTTGTSSSTHWFGHPEPCPNCEGDERFTTEFHGYWLTLCSQCGTEL